MLMSVFNSGSAAVYLTHQEKAAAPLLFFAE